MTPERWKQVENLYHDALERAMKERSAFLAEACAGDDSLFSEVASLLASHEQSNTFIESPPNDVVSSMLSDQRSKQMLGRTLGHYRISFLLGVGGMGEVYLARDTRLDRDVAIKILPEHLTGDPAAMRRFEREAKAVAALSHPNILSIFDFGSEQGLSYAVMELLEGETLRERLNRSALHWREATEIGIAIASGLSAAHTRNVIHRDLKPENIFLTSDGQVKILDFGLARMKRAAASDAETLTSALIKTTTPGLVMGTIGYMSPEQARGEAVEAPSDIFSFGCLMYETISGRRPFAHETAAEVIAAILKEDPLPLRNYANEAPAELDRVISHALRKTSSERYQTAREMLHDLKKLRLESELQARLNSASDPTATDAVRSITAPEVPHQTAGQMASNTQEGVPPFLASHARTKRRIWLSAAALVLIFGGWGAYRMRLQNQARAGGPDPAITPAVGVETLRYYLEMESGSNVSAHSAGLEPIGDRGFRFHFIARSPGYLYIIAPNDDNTPTTFLTSKPIDATGVKTNFLEAGKDFRFPAEGAGIALGHYGNTNPFTVIFSPTPLTKPGFLSSRAYRPLTAPEQRELKTLWKQFGEFAPKSVVETDRDGKGVAVILTADHADAHPIIFEIPIKRL